MKSYTDIEQSKVLSKILPLESADMHYHYDSDFDELESISTITEEDDHFILFPQDVRCWSLAALFSVLPYGYSSILTKSFNGKDYYCKIDGKTFEFKADNPVDACYEMIIRLNELNLL